MKLSKRMICKIWDKFNLPKFSQPLEIKKYENFKLVPTDACKKNMEEIYKKYKENRNN